MTFTSGPVSGQKMVVQVTNSGGDLGENHFDLQIPGGGVGVSCFYIYKFYNDVKLFITNKITIHFIQIFNGCQSQWNTGADGWGDRYGGVRSVEQVCFEILDQNRITIYKVSKSSVTSYHSKLETGMKQTNTLIN